MVENRDGPSTAGVGGGIPTNTTTTNPAADATTAAIAAIAAIVADEHREPLPGVYVHDDFGSYHGDDDEGNHQTSMKTKMANEPMNQASREDIARLSDQISHVTDQVSKLTDMVTQMWQGYKPPYDTNEGSVFAKRPTLMRNAWDPRHGKGNGEDSPPKIIVPSTAKVARLEIEFGSESPEQAQAPEDTGNNSQHPNNSTVWDSPVNSRLDALPLLDGLPAGLSKTREKVPGSTDGSSPFSSSFEESEERSFESSDKIDSPSPANRQPEQRGPESSGKDGSSSSTDRQPEEHGPEPSAKDGSPASSSSSSERSSKLSTEHDSSAVNNAKGHEIERLTPAQEVEQLAANDALLNYFVYYLSHPNHERKPIIERSDVTPAMAQSFRNAAQDRRGKKLQMKTDVRDRVRKLSKDTAVDLYVALSQRYYRECSD
ncbi:hypothetical protein FIE12Z_4217 [Fusarium flagelliforme]|uniref:Uncharacterized protein n=1 Tax=Fusarium flagelliforme TaxID=2675880 RepID=A0A395MU61_9HYPO|nr:hypothetical protein FIE12Z_4217 [Fusarium flagelliforme]